MANKINDEKLKKDLAKAKRELKNSQDINEQLEKENEQMRKNIISVIKIASEMRIILQACRKGMLPIDVARAVDDILAKASTMD